MSLFTERSIWTMLHGIALGGGAMIALFGAFLLIYARGAAPGRGAETDEVTRLVKLISTTAAGLLWIAVLVGTYVVFPPYRATPPEGTTDLSPYPRFLIESDPSTVWLHAFAMEIKEHVPWIAAMMATAVAFVAARHGGWLRSDGSIRRTTMMWLGISLCLVGAVALLGIFVNKVAPVQ